MSTYQADWFLDESGNFDGRSAAASMGIRSEKAAVGEMEGEEVGSDEEDGKATYRTECSFSIIV